MKGNANKRWTTFFDNWKKVVRNPEVSVYTKAVLIDVWLYRSDSVGWYISERKLARDLGVTKQTISNAIKYAVQNELLITGESKERERRKLKLAGFLQSPDKFHTKSSNWVTRKPIKYQIEYQNNNPIKEKEGKITNILSPEEIHKKITAFKERMK